MKIKALMIISYLIVPLYLLPMAFSVFYIAIQKIEDINREVEDKAFKDKRHLNICIVACLIPIVNVVITYISIKVTLKSVFK